jgi:hypothetical protein
LWISGPIAVQTYSFNSSTIPKDRLSDTCWLYRPRRSTAACSMVTETTSWMHRKHAGCTVFSNEIMSTATLSLCNPCYQLKTSYKHSSFYFKKIWSPFLLLNIFIIYCGMSIPVCKCSDYFLINTLSLSLSLSVGRYTFKNQTCYMLTVWL